MVPRGSLYFFGGAAAVPPAAAMKSRLAETAAPAPALVASPAAAAEEEGISDDFSVEDFFVDDGAESPGTEAVEKGKGVVFEAAPVNDVVVAVGTSTPPPPAAAVAAELAGISFPDHDPSEFEWVSLVIDDSLHPPSPGVPPCRLATPTKMLPRVQPLEHRRPLTIPEYRHLSLYRPPPPPERLCNLSTESHVPVKAKRSKRPQPRRSLSLSDSASSAIYSPSSSSSSGSSFSSSSPPHPPAYRNAIVLYDGNEHRSSSKKRPRNKPNRPPRQDIEITDRRCTHCGSQKTPQWRTGPQGPKTLCNACGVRFKSGRLMPEYRPAASPSFNSHVHANSHRKVMEIRRKKEEHHEHRQYRPVPPPVESY